MTPARVANDQQRPERSRSIDGEHRRESGRHGDRRPGRPADRGPDDNGRVMDVAATNRFVIRRMVHTRSSAGGDHRYRTNLVGRVGELTPADEQAAPTLPNAPARRRMAVPGFVGRLRLGVSEQEVDDPCAEVCGHGGGVAPAVDGPQLDLGTLLAPAECLDVTLGSVDAAIEIQCIGGDRRRRVAAVVGHPGLRPSAVRSDSRRWRWTRRRT